MNLDHNHPGLLMSTLYHAEPEQLRIAHNLGPMTLIYHRRSGITHMMSEPVPQILEALDTIGPASVTAVTRHLARCFDLETDEDGAVETIIAARLEELAALGLVRREAA